ncbi:MAG: hypothetical protein HYR85_13770 [Planctomycetes bacterium]|nr:hypothetical protein [Planctomycetota bacterium]MBI3845082.1 hypothetical protein [Planctomycetota bacterium]
MMRDRSRVSSLLASLALVAGCESIAHRSADDDRLAQPLPTEVAARYASHGAHGFESTRSDASNSRWSVFDVSFHLDEPLADRAGAGKFEWYVPAGAHRAPVVLVSPILKGDYALERLLARALAGAGFSAVVLHQPREILDADDGPRELERLMRHNVVEARAVIDWLEGRPEIDPRRIGVLGVSLGSIKSAILLAVEPRVQAGVLVITGGDVAGILEDSVEREVRRWVEKRAARSNEGEADVIDDVRAAFVDDPLALARFVDPREVLLVLARFDHSIPYGYGLRLQRALRGARTIVYPTGHYTLVLFLPAVEDALIHFFRERL